ncbi:MAG: hypothetical protein KDJ47_19235 [Hyphomicrobiaceae bacterium]|nr:hypothetical protein [Hyphomicrobiaceae bacterium]
MLASVMSAAEAAAAIAGGADIIDAKDPRSGALGAVDDATLRAIRAVVRHPIGLSATTGDIPVSEVASIVNEILRVAATGVDLVKIGLFGPADPQPLMAELARQQDVTTSAWGRRVAVLLADDKIDFDLIGTLPGAGFAGVMLDTARKDAGALVDIATTRDLEAFVACGRNAGLFVGLAGSLRLRHIPEVMSLEPDIMGFRGALCRGLSRTDDIDAGAVAAVGAALGKRAAALQPAGAQS